MIVLAAWAAAVVVVKAASLNLHPKVTTAAPAQSEPVKVSKSRRGGDDDVILKRNLFGATDLEVASDSTTPAAGSDDLQLRGVAFSPTGSWAVFENTSSGEQNVFGIGDKVFEGPELTAVDAGGADVILRGKTRRYELKEESVESNAEPEPTPRAGRAGIRNASTKEKKSDKAPSATSGVKKTGEGAYLVDRREIESVVANLNEVITQARAVPAVSNGKSNGFKLFAIRQGSIFQKVGLEDGDIVQRVNDTELTDPSKAVGLLEEIQSMGQIRVNFVRGGKPRTYTYTIR